MSRRPPRARVLSIGLAAGFAALAWAGRARALCPNCLGQNRDWTPTLELLGAFLLVPFLTSFVVFRAIRRAQRSAPR